jgi:hypothetical protein
MALGDGIRRNVATVTSEERGRLKNGILRLIRELFGGTRTDTPIAGGVSFWFKQDEIHQATHVHGGPAFLPWHRELCNRFEAMLRQMDPLVSLHYWDWTTDPRRSPDGRGGSVNLFTRTFMGESDGSAEDPWRTGGCFDPEANPFRSDAPRFAGLPPGENQNPADPPRTLERRLPGHAPNAIPDLPSDDEIVAAPDFTAMHRLLERKHDAIHNYIGGTLAAPHLSFRDPFVFLLHSNVDRLFAMWQLVPGHPERLDPERVYGFEGNTDGLRGILTLMEPWAGNPTNDQSVLRVRPWAPPENEHLLEENQKNSKHQTVVQPPLYDSTLPSFSSVRRFLASQGLDPAHGILKPMRAAAIKSVRQWMAG